MGLFLLVFVFASLGLFTPGIETVNNVQTIYHNFSSFIIYYKTLSTQTRFCCAGVFFVVATG